MSNYAYSPSKLYPAAWLASRVLGWCFVGYLIRRRGNATGSGCASPQVADGNVYPKEETMPREFDSEGLDAYLDIQSQCLVVSQAWEQLEHYRKHGGTLAKKSKDEDGPPHPQETYNESLDDLRDLYAQAEDHGVGDDKLIPLLGDHLPQAVFDNLLRTTTTA